MVRHAHPYFRWRSCVESGFLDVPPILFRLKTSPNLKIQPRPGLELKAPGSARRSPADHGRAGCGPVGREGGVARWRDGWDAMAARGSPERGGVPGGEGAHGRVAWALSVSARAGNRSRVFPYHLRHVDFPPPAILKQAQLGAYPKAIITGRWMSKTLHH